MYHSQERTLPPRVKAIMQPEKDLFSGHAKLYREHRPGYPPGLIDTLLPHLDQFENSWDCGTGNGQVARELSPHFLKVYATDISEQQMQFATRAPNIFYSKQRAEHTDFPSNTFDLITVAQAIHWFDIPAFYKEARRVGRNRAVLAVWGYGLPRINREIDELLQIFYSETIGDYWDPERRHIESEYDTIGFEFPIISAGEDFQIRKPMDLPAFAGYLSSWSAVQKFRADKKPDPVQPFIDKLGQYWDPTEHKEARHPIFMKAGRILKKD